MGQIPPGQSPQAAAIAALQAQAQNVQMMQGGPAAGHGGPGPQAAGFPPGIALPPGMPPGALQNMTPQQQMRMAQAMMFQQQQQQAQQPPQQQQPQPPQQGPTPMRPGMPPLPPGIRPPPGINPNEFPFDARLLPHLPHAHDPRWREEWQQRNPRLVQEVQSIAQRIQSGEIRPEMVQRMQQFVLYMQRLGQSRGQGPSGPPPQGPPGMPQLQNQPMAGMGGPIRPPVSQVDGAGSPGSMPSAQQQAFPPPGIATKVRPPGSGAPGAPESPSPVTSGILARRQSNKPEKRNMPPPTFIPSHGGAVRPPPAEQPPTPQAAPNALPVREWEGKLRTDIPVTGIMSLPVNEIDESEDPTFGGKLPALSDREKADVKAWLAADINFAETFQEKRKKTSGVKVQRWMENEEKCTPWWMMRRGETPPRRPSSNINVIYPQEKAAQRHRARKRREIRFTPGQLKSMADVQEHLVPVRLELEHDHQRFSDTFMWNCSDTVVTPEMFAQILCDDFKLPGGQFIPKIVAAIKERVREYEDQVQPIQPKADNYDHGRGVICEEYPESHSLQEIFRQAHEQEEGDDEVRTDEGADQDDTPIRVVSFDHEADDKVMTVDEAMACLDTGKDDDELRFLVKLDIIVGTQNLSDTFEWDLNSSVSPEEFAASYCTDLGLGGEFVTAISHDIREQIVTHQRSLFIVGHTPGSGFIMNDDVRAAFLPPVTAALRKEELAMSTFTPVLANFTEADVAAIEKDRERESKRKKRATRGRRGIVLPDREPLKTFRTLLHPLTDANGNIVVVDPTPAPVSSTRRAAAIAAQANINLALQDLPIERPPSPPAAAVHALKHHPKRHLSRSSRGASAASTREGSVANGDHTPNLGLKRSLLDDSEPEAASPHPSKKRFNGRIDSPEEAVSSATMEELKLWHCKTCGVPEHLSGGKRPDLNGAMDLCVKCGEFLQRNGRKRSVQYNEDEDYHRQQQAKDDDDEPPQPAFELPVPAPPQRNYDDEESSSSSDSDSSDDDYGVKARKPASSSKPRTASMSTSAAPPTPARASTTTPATPATPHPPPGPSMPQPPAWLEPVKSAMQSKYPQSRWAVVPKQIVGEDGEIWRVKCLDCPGKIYKLGPGETLENFELHLKNKAHNANVQARLSKQG